MKNTVYEINHEAVKRDFSRAANHYDEHADLQRTVIEEAVAFCQHHMANDALVLDVGCGTGYLAKYISNQPINWRIIQCDIAEGMAQKASPHAKWTVCGDATSLPFKQNTCNAIFCSLCLQWINQPILVFKEFARILPQDAYMLITSFAPESMQELRKTVMENKIPLQLHTFPSSDTLLEQMHRSDLILIKHQVKQHTIYFHNFKSIRNYFKGLGAKAKANSELLLSHNKEIMEKINHAFNTYHGHIPLSFYVDYYLLKRH